VTRNGLDGPGFEPWWGGGDTLDSPRLVWRPIQPHINGDWVSFLGVKWSGHGDGHPSPSSAEVVYRQRFTSPQ